MNKISLIIIPVVFTMILSGCVSQQEYDKLEAENFTRIGSMEEEIDALKFENAILKSSIEEAKDSMDGDCDDMYGAIDNLGSY